MWTAVHIRTSVVLNLDLHHPWGGNSLSACRAYERGGSVGQWPRGPWILGGPSWGLLASTGPAEDPWALEGPSKWHWEVSMWKTEDLFFFFGNHIKIRTKLWHFSVKTFFLGGRSPQIQTKPWHIPRPFWSLQNWRCVIFELTPGPRLALGALICLCHV